MLHTDDSSIFTLNELYLAVKGLGRFCAKTGSTFGEKYKYKMKKILIPIVTLLICFLSVNHVNAQFGDLKNKVNKTKESVNKKNKDLKTKGKKVNKMIVPEPSAFPALVQTDAYKQQVRSSGASSKINRVDQLVVLYLRDKQKWKAKGFQSYKGFLTARISRVEDGRKGVFDMAPTWYMLPFYTKIIKEMKSELKNSETENTIAENAAYDAEVKEKRDKYVADSLTYLKEVDQEFAELKISRPLKKEQEILSDMHRNNIGKVVFSRMEIPIENPSNSQLTSNFTSDDEIYMRAYIGKAVRNIDLNPTNPKKEIYNDLLLRSNGFYMEYYVDGKKTSYREDGLYSTMDNEERNGLEPLTFSDSWHAKDPNKPGYYRSTSFIEYIRTLSKGKHTIEIKAYSSDVELDFTDPDLAKEARFEPNYNIREDLWDSSKVTVENTSNTLLFEGEFTMNVTGPMPSGYKWSSVEAGKMNNNSAVRSGIRSAMNAGNLEIVDFKIVSDDYDFRRNELTGIVLSRHVLVAVAYKSKRGILYRGYKYYVQNHNGSSFQKTWLPGGFTGSSKLLDM